MTTVVVALTALFGAFASGQADTLGGFGSVPGQEGELAPHRFVCFRIHPAPQCQSYWVLEVQGVFPVMSSAQRFRSGGGAPATPREVFTDNNLELNLGYMVNVTPTVSMGGAVALGSGSGHAFDGARARLRWWMIPASSLEFEVGVLRTNLGSFLGSAVTGPSLGMRLNYKDRGAVLVRYDRVEIPAGNRWAGGAASGVSIGASVSSGGALAAGALIGLGLVVLFLLAPGG